MTCAVEAEVVLLYGILIACLYPNACLGEDPLVFTISPENKTVRLGHAIDFLCELNRPSDSPVHWTLNGNNVQGFTGYTYNTVSEHAKYTLTIDSVTLKDDGPVQCRTGSLKSNFGGLNVVLRPSHFEMKNRVGNSLPVVLGEMSQATCYTEKSRPPATYEWYMDKQLVTDSTKIETIVSPFESDTKASSKDAIFYNTNSTLSFNVTNLHSREITCHIKHIAMIASSEFTVHTDIKYRPKIAMNIKHMDMLKEGGSLEAQCTVVANPPEVAYSWMKNNLLLDGEHSKTLRIETLDKDDNGVDFGCIAKNIIGSSLYSVNLNVAYSPQFLEFEGYVGADLGSSVSLNCHVHSNPKASYIWTSQGRQISTSVSFKIREINSLKVFGDYSCTATVPGYKPITKTIQLVQNGKPTISAVDKQYAKFGKTGTIICDIFAIPRASDIIWFKNGYILKESDKLMITKEDMITRTRSTLTIKHVNNEDFSQYNCTAHNTYGNDFQLISFNRKASINLTYIIVGLAIGILFIIIISVVIFMLQRRSVLKGSTSSTSELNGQSHTKREPVISTMYSSNPVEEWRNSNATNDLDQHSYNPYVQHVRPNYSTLDGHHKYDERLSDRYEQPEFNRFNSLNTRCVSQLSTNV